MEERDGMGQIVSWTCSEKEGNKLRLREGILYTVAGKQYNLVALCVFLYNNMH